MAKCSCSCKCDCTGIGIVLSIIVGIITAVTVYNGLIDVTPAFLWAIFGIGTVSLFVALIAAIEIRAAGLEGCICPVVSTLLIGIIGTIISSAFALGFGIAAASIPLAILAAIVTIFTLIMISSFACLTICVSGCD